MVAFSGLWNRFLKNANSKHEYDEYDSEARAVTAEQKLKNFKRTNNARIAKIVKKTVAASDAKPANGASSSSTEAEGRFTRLFNSRLLKAAGRGEKRKKIAKQVIAIRRQPNASAWYT